MRRISFCAVLGALALVQAGVTSAPAGADSPDLASSTAAKSTTASRTPVLQTKGLWSATHDPATSIQVPEQGGSTGGGSTTTTLTVSTAHGSSDGVNFFYMVWTASVTGPTSSNSGAPGG
jgi:hypothetical protein